MQRFSTLALFVLGLSGTGCIIVSDTYDDTSYAYCDESGCWWCDDWDCYTYECSDESECPDACSCDAGQCVSDLFDPADGLIEVEPPAASTSTETTPPATPLADGAVSPAEGGEGPAPEEAAVSQESENSATTEAPTVGQPSDQPQQRCEASCECPEGQLCEEGLCASPPSTELPEIPAKSCAADCDCPSGDRCLSGFCQPACTSAQDCSEGQTCVDGACQAAVDLIPEEGAGCQFDNQCDPASACLNGACHLRCGVEGLCPPGERCAGGEVCVPDPEHTTECVYSAECGETAVCVDGACVAACEDDQVCGAGCLCEQGLCRPDRLPSPQCLRTAECGLDRSCVDAVCRDRCSDGTSCGGEAECVRGFCIPVSELSPECSLNQDCSGEQQCLNARCVVLQ